MDLVVFHLLGPSAVCLPDCLLHRIRDSVGVHDDKTVDISGGPARRLGQCPSGAQEAFLVGVQNRHKRNCRNIKAFPQEVDSYQDIEQAVLEVLDDLDSLGSVHVGMDVPDPDSDPVQIVGKFLGHPLGQGGDKDPLIVLRPLPDLFDKVVHLVFRRAHLNRRVKETCRPDNLLNHKTFRSVKLVIRRCGANIDLLPRDSVELIELQRPVVSGRGKAESIFDKDRLT